jgi:hypothetical protein
MELSKDQKDLLEDVLFDLDSAIDGIQGFLEEVLIPDDLLEKVELHIANIIHASNSLNGLEMELTGAMTPKKRFHTYSN